jgi:DnaJ-class molecular chaperone
MNSNNYYNILGLPPTATREEIKKAYRKLALRFHPDKNREDSPAEATRKFREISRAYDILKNPKTRRQYDLQFQDSGHHETALGDDFFHRDPFVVFDEFFGPHPPFGGSSRPNLFVFTGTPETSAQYQVGRRSNLF